MKSAKSTQQSDLYYDQSKIETAIKTFLTSNLEKTLLSACFEGISTENINLSYLFRNLRQLGYAGNIRTQRVFGQAMFKYICGKDYNQSSKTQNVTALTANMLELFSEQNEYLGLELLSRLIWCANYETAVDKGDGQSCPCQEALEKIVDNFEGLLLLLFYIYLLMLNLLL
jgi:hypothetical protein